jgi:hypothetical protein
VCVVQQGPTGVTLGAIVAVHVAVANRGDWSREAIGEFGATVGDEEFWCREKVESRTRGVLASASSFAVYSNYGS